MQSRPPDLDAPDASGSSTSSSCGGGDVLTGERRSGAVPQLPVYLLTGPTGTGKSDWAIRLAQVAPVEIVSVDSALVYRGLDIGTAKPAGSCARSCRII